MKLWIARDSDGTLWLHEGKPEIVNNPKTDTQFWISSKDWREIDQTFLPEVTFENSPIEVELKLTNNNANR